MYLLYIAYTLYYIHHIHICMFCVSFFFCEIAEAALTTTTPCGGPCFVIWPSPHLRLLRALSLSSSLSCRSRLDCLCSWDFCVNSAWLYKCLASTTPQCHTHTEFAESLTLHCARFTNPNGQTNPIHPPHSVYHDLDEAFHFITTNNNQKTHRTDTRQRASCGLSTYHILNLWYEEFAFGSPGS